MANLRNNLLAGTVAPVASVLTYAVHHRLFPPPARPGTEYPITGLLWANHTWGVSGVFLVIGAVLGYALRASALAVGAGLVLLGVAATAYEIARSPTSHNLLPFDILGFVVCAAPLAIGALVGRTVAERRSRLPAG